MNFKPANIPVNDAQRVKAVKRTGVLDESKTELYDIYCFLAKEITGCPVSWTGVIDNEKQVVLARDGFPDEVPMEMPREQTLCQFAIEKTEPLIINDMTIDYRFKNHPAVIEFGVKFYAAFPVTTSDGYTLGTLCVSDKRVRRLSKNKIFLLKGLASKLSYQLEKVLEKYQIKISKYISEIYVENYFQGKRNEFPVMVYEIINGINENEVKLVPKNTINKGFFEKFFQLFS